jgi:hypothetical protein
MEPNFDQSAVEAEIRQLSQEIDAKRKLLESQKGVYEESGSGDKELVRTALAEKIFPPSAGSGQVATTTEPQAQQTAPAKKADSGASYLDSLDEDTVASVNLLVGAVFTGGLKNAISKAQVQTPYILDAFHDALTDKLYEELKSRKLAK